MNQHIKTILDWLSEGSHRQILWPITVMVAIMMLGMNSCIVSCNQNEAENHRYRLERDKATEESFKRMQESGKESRGQEGETQIGR